MGLATNIDTHNPVAQPFHWKRFQWRLLEPASATQFSGLVDAVWAGITLYPAPPDHYVRAMWHYASSVVPRAPTAAIVMKRLRTLTPPCPRIACRSCPGCFASQSRSKGVSAWRLP